MAMGSVYQMIVPLGVNPGFPPVLLRFLGAKVA
jgi:hypothetical protein